MLSAVMFFAASSILTMRMPLRPTCRPRRDARPSSPIIALHLTTMTLRVPVWRSPATRMTDARKRCAAEATFAGGAMQHAPVRGLEEPRTGEIGAALSPQLKQQVVPQHL